MDGKPFFVVSQAVDPGLLQVLECDIVPRLENGLLRRICGRFSPWLIQPWFGFCIC
jgi:hypothetical protein